MVSRILDNLTVTNPKTNRVVASNKHLKTLIINKTIPVPKGLLLKNGKLVVAKKVKQSKYAELKEFLTAQGDGMYELNINDKNMFFENSKQNRDNLIEFFAEFLYDDEIDNFEATKFEKFVPQKTIQYFKNGKTNCLFSPIIEHCNKKINSDIPKKTKGNYITIKNKCIELEYLYKDGVPETQEHFDNISEVLKVTIEIYPIKKLIDEQEQYIIKGTCKGSILNFKFYNTGLNHVDYIGGEVEETLTLTKPTDGFYIQKKYKGNVIEIITKDGIKRLINPKKETFDKFEKETGMKYFKINATRDPELSKFIFAGLHDSQTYDFQYIKRDNIECEIDSLRRQRSIDEHSEGINSIDQVKSYTNVRSCEFYRGYPAKITDFRKTNKIEGLGLYEITNLKTNKLLTTLGFADGVYPSPVLEFLLAKNSTFEIIQGAWGTSFDFDYPDYMFEKDKNGVSNYCTFAGCSTISTDKTYYECSPDLAYVLNESFLKDERCMFSHKKSYRKHLAHIFSFTFAYVYIKSIQKLEEIINQNGYNSLVRICKDGIYYTGNKIKETPFWTHKTEIKLGNYGHKYINSNPSDTIAPGHYKQFNQHQILLGAGGTGKTSITANDSGYIGKFYIVTSYKLLAKQLESHPDLTGTVLAIHIQKNADPEKKEIIKYANVLLFDECSMITEKLKMDIIKSYPYHVIIFIGDPECQLAPCGDPYPDETRDEQRLRLQPMSCEKLKITEFNTYYRFDEEFSVVQPKIRKLIKLKGDNRFDVDNMLRMFQTINLKELKNKYTPEDIILCYRKTTGLFYDKMFEHLEKYYITRGSPNFPTGCIYLTEPEKGSFIKRHGYTTHSVQGETFEHNIYIDIEDLRASHIDEYKRLIYTAITRSRTIKKIYLINK